MDFSIRTMNIDDKKLVRVINNTKPIKLTNTLIAPRSIVDIFLTAVEIKACIKNGADVYNLEYDNGYRTGYKLDKENYNLIYNIKRIDTDIKEDEPAVSDHPTAIVAPIRHRIYDRYISATESEDKILDNATTNQDESVDNKVINTEEEPINDTIQEEEIIVNTPAPIDDEVPTTEDTEQYQQDSYKKNKKKKKH